jgi:hypothetical protein
MLTQVQDTVAQVPVQAWAGLLALTTLAFGYLIARKAPARTSQPKTRDPKKRRTLTGFLGMGLVVLLGFGVSASTSIVFAEVRLHMEAPWTLTVGLALEGIVLGLTLYSWAFEDKGTARAAYLLVLAQAIGAIEVVRFQHEDLGVALVRIVGPVMLAYGLHKLLGLETKLKKIEIKSDGMLARFWRDRVKRLESKLGIGSRGADAQAISRRNAQDRLVTLATLGKPWWAIGTFGTRRYEKALMRAGDASFHGLGDTLDELGTEMRITTRIDRMGAFKNLPNRSEDYTLRSLRPAPESQGAPTSETGLTPSDQRGRTWGRPGHAQREPGRGAGEQEARHERSRPPHPRLRPLLRPPRHRPAPLPEHLREGLAHRRIRAQTDDIRALYKDIHTKVTGNNP